MQDFKVSIIWFLFSLSAVAETQMISIKGGVFTPLYGSAKQPIQVSSFYISENPVTNAEFWQFIKDSPKWQKTEIKQIFAEKNYLRHWQSQNVLGPFAPAESPVVNVSWYAAKAYCESKKQRLPKVYEWEYVASQEVPGQDIQKVILAWYAVPNPEIFPSIKRGFKNKMGVANLHGLIWEWTLDFNSTMLSGESRSDGSLDKNLFCGSGSLGAADSSDYAAFVRFSYRSSLKANYTIGNLGFRCALDDLKK